jgi:cellulose synthase/poly-beta-1,6-N-acetylglucosamine synthase-like glycosyltransferase
VSRFYYDPVELLTLTLIRAKQKGSWVLKYVKSAIGETDCPDTIPEFIAQRRR